MPDSILILGSGALATLFAARLAATGLPVNMLATWPQGLRALDQHGARLLDASGEHSYPFQASADPQDFTDSQLALVLVKSWQTERAASQLQACLASDGLALTLQNGLGNHEILAAALGQQRVALGTTTTGASLEAPGLVRAGGEGHILLGRHPRIQPLHDLLAHAGFNVQLADEIDPLIWGKLAVNAAINPLTALLEVPNGVLLEDETHKAWMRALAGEVAAVAAAQGISLPFDDAYAAALDVAQRTARNRSSMLQDIQRGAPTEIEAICGAVVEIGQQLGIPTPANAAMLKQLRAKLRGQPLPLEDLHALPLS